MNLITPIIEQLTPVSMDDMLREAMKLGSIDLKQDSWNRESSWTAEITFKRASGTRIHAKGTDTNPWFAMAKAIDEAREMGAGEPT